MRHFSLLLLLLIASVPLRAQTTAPGRIEVIDFRELPLRQAARIFSDLTGMNVVPSAEAAKLTVSLYLSNVSARDALSALCKAHDLVFRDDPLSKIVRVHTPAEYQRDLSSFREETTEVFTLRYPNAHDVARSIRDLFGDRVRLNLQERDDHTVEELEQRFERFDVIDERSNGLGLAESGGTTTTTQNGGNLTRSSSGNLSSAGGGGRTYEANRLRSAAVNLPPPARLEGLNAEEVQALETAPALERERAVQQLVERRVDIFVNVINRLNKVMVRTSDSRTMEQIRDLITRIDVPTPTVLLEVKIFSVRLTQGFSSAVDYLFSDGTTSVGFTSNGVREGDLVFQYVNKNFQARLQVLEDKGQVRTISTPTLLTANNEVSRLFVGEERPLNRSFTGPQTIVGNSTVVSGGSTAVQFRPVGTTLLITPNINADKTVTLRLLQENSNIVPNGASVLVPSNNGFAPQNVDTVQSRSVSGTIVARDRVPVVIGGLIDTSLNDTRSQVPLLGDIPVLGYLFGRRQNTKTRNELVMVITPHLIDPREGGADASHEVMERAEAQIIEQIQAERAINQKLVRKYPAPMPRDIPRAVPIATPLPRSKPLPTPRPRSGK